MSYFKETVYHFCCEKCSKDWEISEFFEDMTVEPEYYDMACPYCSQIQQHTNIDEYDVEEALTNKVNNSKQSLLENKVKELGKRVYDLEINQYKNKPVQPFIPPYVIPDPPTYRQYPPIVWASDEPERWAVSVWSTDNTDSTIAPNKCGGCGL